MSLKRRAAFFYPEHTRYDFLALRAFNVELSNVADSVKNLHLGKLRFQWWRDAVASLSGVGGFTLKSIETKLFLDLTSPASYCASFVSCKSAAEAIDIPLE